MFSLLENKDDVKKAQSRLEKTIKKSFKTMRNMKIGFPAGNIPNAKIRTDGTHWFWSTDHRVKGSIARRLNWFGLMKEHGHLHISVEVNTPYLGADSRIAGFFARDNDTGNVYLMHSGKVGGGKKGVGKKAFLAWSEQELFVVMDSLGRKRLGVIVMPVEGHYVISPLKRYIDTTAAFKEAVRKGEVSTAILSSKLSYLEDYFAEATGRRKGKRSAEIDYVSRHGEVVDALKDWWLKIDQRKNLRMVKSILIDLGVQRRGKLTEVFEVKTKVTRSDIYTAIGQLEVHCEGNACQKYMVIPESDVLIEGIDETLKRLKIRLIRYRLGNAVSNFKLS